MDRRNVSNSGTTMVLAQNAQLPTPYNIDRVRKDRFNRKPSTVLIKTDWKNNNKKKEVTVQQIDKY